MGYPYGQPGNSGYGVHPQSGYAQPGYPQPGVLVRKPGRGTAITAGVLAAIQGLLALALTVEGAFETRQDRHDGIGGNTGNIVALLLVATFTGLYLSGAILLFFRRRAGRYLIAGMSGLILLAGACGLIYSVVVYGLAQEDVVPLSITVAIVFVLELLTLCMALMSSTGRWIAARTADANVPAAHQPSAPGYGPYPPY